MDEQLNKPMYLYRIPMFSLTVSVVIILENGVLLIENGVDGIISKPIYRFPGGVVKAGLETIQFAAVRYVKEQTGILLKKGNLMPVDFRSDPDRSESGNVVDIGFVCFLDKYSENYHKATWKEVDFEKGCMAEKINFHMDHDTLLERALEFSGIVKA